MEETSEMYFHKFQHDINCLSDNVILIFIYLFFLIE